MYRERSDWGLPRVKTEALKLVNTLIFALSLLGWAVLTIFGFKESMSYFGSELAGVFIGSGLAGILFSSLVYSVISVFANYVDYASRKN